MMKTRISACLLAGLLAFMSLVMTAVAQDKAGEGLKVVADLSTHTVSIKTDFAGTRVMLFGALVGAPEEGKKKPDIIIVVRGPRQTFKLHRKKHVAVIWVNADERIIRDAPGYYAVLSSGMLDSIISAEKRGQLGIGFEALKQSLLKRAKGFRSSDEAKEYVDALIRLLKEKGLYRSNDNGVVMTGRYLFRATFDLPANVPLGQYEADVYMFRNHELIGRFSSPLKIEKRGFERFVYEMAHKRALLYGISAVVIAIAAGFLAAAIFRKS